MMVAKRPDSIRSLGWVKVNMDKVLRAKFKQLAGDTPLIDYLRQLADKELANRQGEFMPVDNTVASVKQDTTSIMRALAVVLRYLGGKGALSEADLEALRGSKLYFLTDEAIIGTAKEVKGAVQNRLIANNSVEPGEVKREA